MNSEILIRYVHFISIFTIVGAIVSQHLLLKEAMTPKEIKRMARIDSIYGVAAIIAVAAGLTLWFGVGKAADFYTRNWIFHLKVGLAVLLGILSLPPTIFFMKNRKVENQESPIPIPAYVKILIRIELLLLLFLV